MTASGARLLDHLGRHRDEMVELCRALVRAESPTTSPESQAGAQGLLHDRLTDLGFGIRRVAGTTSGGYLVALPADRVSGQPYQLLVGHSDTVWPLGTVANRPPELRDGRLYGPGAYDMKAGLVQAMFALAALRALDAMPEVTPVLLVNSDEEKGSWESRREIERIARRADRALILEPSLGPGGKLKTRRKGVGRFTVHVKGVAAHAGLDPDRGVSAIVELSHVVAALHALNDVERGITVNVGTIEGGIRPNVVAPEARADADVRVWRHADAAEVEVAIRRLQPTTSGTEISVEGDFGRPPMEPTPGAAELWARAQEAAASIGLEIEEGAAGGASDGNNTAQHVPTLDGLGAVGDGAHAQDEFVFVDAMVERGALLARLMLEPPLGKEAAR